MRVFYLLILFIALNAFPAAAQPRCGFDPVHQQLMTGSPVYGQKVAAMNSQWVQSQSTTSNSLVVNSTSGTTYEIPVVIHVIHTGNPVGGQYNPSDAQLLGMIEYLNQTYAATYGSYPNVNNGGVYFPVKFVLAKRDPSCNPTTGILRVNGSSVPDYAANGISAGGVGASEVDVKALSKWSNTEYYNIWIVNKIDGADGTVGQYIAGYAYFPGAPASVDGTVMLATQALSGKITLPHEIGHAFGLYHTFEGDGTGSTCPTNTNCATQGDMVCDTEPHKRSPFNCPTGTNPCTGTSYNNVTNNFMDYSNCQNRFTEGQKTRFLNIMLNSRPFLTQSAAGNAPAPLTASACTITGLTYPGNGANMGPNFVQLNELSYFSNGYNNEGNAFYLDRSCFYQTGLVRGQSYSITVSTATNRQNVAVWIDYNNDGAFTLSERVYYHAGTIAGAETHTGTIIVPATATTCAPLRMRVIADWYLATIPANGCGTLEYGQAEDYTVNIVPEPVTLTNTITSGSNPSCAGSALTFTATPATALTAPVYTWYVNNVAAGSGNTFTTSSIADGSTVYSRVDYTVACGGADSAFSNVITVSRTAQVTPSVTISVTDNTICAGSSVTFTATPVNGGTAPSYQWTVNGVNAGTNNAVFSTTSLADGDSVRVVMTSNATCVTTAVVTSNAIGMTVSATGTWTGETSSDWMTPSNWCGGVPGPTTDVEIPPTAPFMPILNTTTTVGSFRNKGSMTVGPSGVLHVQ